MTGPEELLSVVIASHNAAETLPAQLSALASQDDGGPFEVIVVDNRSTDDTDRVVAEWAERLVLVLVRAMEGRGPGYARNVGVASARSELIVFCDADDVVGPGWLAAMRRGLDEHRFIAGKLEGDLLNSRWVREARALDQSAGLQFTPWISDLPVAGAGNMGIHRSVFNAVGGFDLGEGSLEDDDLCWRVQESGEPLVYVPDAVVQVRLRATVGAIFRQAFSYGRGMRLLEQRHGGNPPAEGSVPGPTGDEPGSQRRSFRGRVGAGVWRLGWVLGRRWPSTPKAGVTSGPPAARASS